MRAVTVANGPSKVEMTEPDLLRFCPSPLSDLTIRVPGTQLQVPSISPYAFPGLPEPFDLSLLP